MTSTDDFDVSCKDRECARCRAVRADLGETSPYAVEAYPPDIAALTAYRARLARTANPAR